MKEDRVFEEELRVTFFAFPLALASSTIVHHSAVKSPSLILNVQLSKCFLLQPLDFCAIRFLTRNFVFLA